jgi:membrane protein
MVLLAWVYYSAQILFLGAEFTQVYANRFGSHLKPARGAVFVSEVERIHEGIPHAQTIEKAIQDDRERKRAS